LSAHWISPLVPGALIYNRLFAWKASFAVVPADWPIATFLMNSTICHRSCQIAARIPLPVVHAAQTIKAVNTASTGSAAVSRNRFREEIFLEFIIPFPALGTTRIVAAGGSSKRCCRNGCPKIQKLEHEIETTFWPTWA
jgi:type I restriction enzyme S subunit